MKHKMNHFKLSCTAGLAIVLLLFPHGGFGGSPNTYTIDGVDWWYCGCANGVVLEKTVGTAWVNACDPLPTGDYHGIPQTLPYPYPSTSYETATVVAIGPYAFSGAQELTSIELPRAVSRIGSFAFKDCKKLRKISGGSILIDSGDYITGQLGDQLQGTSAFGGCEHLEEFSMFSSNTTMIAYGMFAACHSLTIVLVRVMVSTVGARVPRARRPYAVARDARPYRFWY